MSIHELAGYLTIISAGLAFIGVLKVYRKQTNGIAGIIFANLALIAVTLLFGLATTIQVNFDLVLYPIRIVALMQIAFYCFAYQKH